MAGIGIRPEKQGRQRGADAATNLTFVGPGVLGLCVFYLQIPFVRVLWMDDGEPLITRVQKVVRCQNMQITFSHPRNLKGTNKQV